MTALKEDALEPLVAALLKRAPRMNFFQLCHLLELQSPDRSGFGEQDCIAHEPVRFRPFPNASFPSSEVMKVDLVDDGEYPGSTHRPSVRTSFLGLYGVDAAMPSHLIDDIMLRSEGHEAVMAFLDQFNHRIVTLLYRAWKKYRYPIGFRAGGTDERSRDLLSLVGFGIGQKSARAGLASSRVLSLLGLLNQRTRTAEGLAGAVALTVPGAGVKVDEFHPVWIKVATPARLGPAPAGLDAGGAKRKGLGRDTVVGKRISYRSKAVKLTLQPASAAQAHALLPGCQLHLDLMGILRVYVGIKADIVLRMEVSAAILPDLVLGQAAILETADVGEANVVPPGRLAWTTLLKPKSDRIMTLTLGRYEAISSKT